MSVDLQYQLYLLLIGQLFTVVLLFLTHYLNKRTTEQTLNSEIRKKKHVDLIEKQLTDFYGPIYILLSINHSILGLRFDSNKGEYTNIVSEEVWHDMRDKIITPNNDEIVKIIRNNIHLIDNSIIHESILKFIIHAEVRKRELDKKMPMEEYLAHYKFPEEFQDLIYTTTKQLKQEHFNLVGKDDKNK